MTSRSKGRGGGRRETGARPERGRGGSQPYPADPWPERTDRSWEAPPRRPVQEQTVTGVLNPTRQVRRGRDLARRLRRREPWEPGWGEPAYKPSSSPRGKWRFFFLALALAILSLGAALTAIHFLTQGTAPGTKAVVEAPQQSTRPLPLRISGAPDSGTRPGIRCA